MSEQARMSDEERQKKKMEKWLSTLTVDSEFFGLLGMKDTDSFYRLYVRQNSTTKKWWKLETAGYVALHDPIKYQKTLSKERETKNARGKLPDLLKYKFHSDKKGIEQVFSRVKELSAV